LLLCCGGCIGGLGLGCFFEGEGFLGDGR
jgi:hypothetical protein